MASSEGDDRRPRIEPERRTRLDLIITAVITALVLIAGITLWWTGSARTTELETAPKSPSAPIPAGDAPTRLHELWRAKSSSTAVPAIGRTTIVSADGGTVIGHDLTSGEQLWRYKRDAELCAAMAAWPGGENDAIAVYRTSRGCSDVTALDAGTGLRKAIRTSDADKQIALSYDDGFALSAGDERLETWGTNLVRGIEYGRVEAPLNPDVSPDRTACRIHSAISGASRVALIERCSDDDGYRLTLLGSTLDDDEKVTEYGSQQITASATDPAPVVVATTDATVTVYDGGGHDRGAPRIRLFDDQIEETDSKPVDGEQTPPPGSRPIRGQGLITYWTGKTTVVIDAGNGEPRFDVPGAIGPGEMSIGVLVPIRGAISVRDPNNGREVRKVPVDRGDYDGVVSVRAIGTYVVEQRGDEIVVLGR